MNAVDLIRFLLPTKPGRINALNSPFERENFQIEIAERWVRANKATIIDGILVFHDDYRLMVLRQMAEDQLQAQQDAHFDSMVDLERSNGRHATGGIGVWSTKSSGSATVHQMRVRFHP